MSDRHLIVAGLLVGLLTLLLVGELSKETIGKDDLFLVAGFIGGVTLMWMIVNGRKPK